MPVRFALVYFGYEDGYISKEMRKLNKRFNILPDYTTHPRKLGQVVKSSRLNEQYMIYGFIIAKTCTVPFDFIALRNCAIELNHLMEENNYDHITLDAVLDVYEWDYRIK